MDRADWMMLSDRRVLRLRGRDRRDLLQGVVTADVTRLTSDHALFAALLTPQGKLLHDFILIEDGDTIRMDVHETGAADLMKKLSLYKLRADVAIDVDEDMGVAVSLLGEGAPPSDAAVVICDPRIEDLGRRAYCAADTLRAQADDDAAPFTAHRRQLGVAEMGAELASGAVFPLEANHDALRGVDFQKGCFVGQEVASRMKRKQAIRRRILPFISEGVAESGAEITSGDHKLGEVVAAWHGGGFASIRLDRLAEAGGPAKPCWASGRNVQIRTPAWLTPHLADSVDA